MAKFKTNKIDHTGVTVSDINASLAFYHDVFGFDVTEPRRLEGEFFETLTGVKDAKLDVAYVEAPGHRIELLQYTIPGERKPSTLRPSDPGFVHLAFEVEDIDEVVTAIREGGFEPVSKPLTSEAGLRKGWRAVYTRDPDGNVIEFLQPPKE
ncbi:MAG: VOC family protein [Rhodospirillales bacterium]|nr:VOC family protein [Rhodospirillales bacterium]